MTKDKEKLECIIIDNDENVDIEPTPEVMEELAKMMEADRRKEQDKD